MSFSTPCQSSKKRVDFVECSSYIIYTACKSGDVRGVVFSVRIRVDEFLMFSIWVARLRNNAVYSLNSFDSWPGSSTRSRVLYILNFTSII